MILRQASQGHAFLLTLARDRKHAPVRRRPGRLAPDLVIEAVRYQPKAAKGAVPYVFGVQWHPEFVDPANRELLDPAPILKDFLYAVRERKNC